MLKQSVIDQMKEYQYRQTMIKAVKYQEGMEDAWLVGRRTLYGDRIFVSKEEAIVDMVSNRNCVMFPILLNEMTDDFDKISTHTIEYCEKRYIYTEIKDGMWLYIDENGQKNVLSEEDFLKRYQLKKNEYIHIGYDEESERLYVENNCFRVYVEKSEIATVEKLLEGFEIPFTEKVGQVFYK